MMQILLKCDLLGLWLRLLYPSMALQLDVPFRISKESFNDSGSLKMKCVGLNVKICDVMVKIQVLNCALIDRF